MKIRIDFISKNYLSNLSINDKIKTIIERIKNDVVVILEEGLTPEEEMLLIKETMKEIDHEKFLGVEYFDLNGRNKFSKFFFGKRRKMMIIVNSRIIENVKRERNFVTFLINTKRR